MKIGITGHQEREGADWLWVKKELTTVLSGASCIKGYSSLALGTDQIFAEIVYKLDGVIIAVLPFKDYRRCFGEQWKSYDSLLKLSQEVQLDSKKEDHQAFLDAGKWIVDQVDLMLAVWDEEPAEGKGGTADIIKYARLSERPLIIMNPITRMVASGALGLLQRD